jgi:DNA-binding MarR family transcriptional regulator
MLETTTPLVGPDELVGFLARSAQAWDEIAPETDRDTVVVFGLLEAAARTWRSVHSGVLARFELNLAEWTTIGMLRTSPPDFRRSPTELRHLVGQTSAGMTRVLTKLADARLVRREPGSRDGRRHDVLLTRRGQVVAEESFRALHAVQRELLEAFPTAERARLIGALDELRQALRDGPRRAPVAPAPRRVRSSATAR